MKVWRVAGLVTSWQMTASICFYSVFAGSVLLRNAFDISRTLTGFLMTAMMIGYTLFLFPMGTLVDSYGAKPVMVVGLTGMAAGTLLIGVTETYLTLAFAVLLLGAMYATAMPSTNKAIVTTVPPSQLNFLLGIKQVGVTVGSGISAVLVTTFAEIYRWRIGFLLTGAIAIVVSVCFFLWYRGADGEGGSALPKPRRLLDNRDYLVVLGGGFFFGAALFTTVGYTVVYLSESVGISIAFGGFVLATMQITGSLGRISMGRIIDRTTVPNDRAAITVFAIQAGLSGVILLSVTSVAISRTAALVIFGLLGFVLFGFTGVYYSCITELIADEFVGEATAGGQTALNVGAIGAPPLFGYVVDQLSYSWGWWLLAGCCFAAAFFATAAVTTYRS